MQKHVDSRSAIEVGLNEQNNISLYLLYCPIKTDVNLTYFSDFFAKTKNISIRDKLFK
jgi:hypothetical protein